MFEVNKSIKAFLLAESSLNTWPAHRCDILSSIFDYHETFESLEVSHSKLICKIVRFITSSWRFFIHFNLSVHSNISIIESNNNTGPFK